MAGRIVYVSFAAVAVSAIQDFFEIRPAAEKPVVLHEVHITQDAGETSEQLPVAVKRLTATVTSGTGGGSPDVRKLRSSDTAIAFASERNNTTPATSSGNTEVLMRMGDNVLNGWHWVCLPESRPEFVNTEALIVKLETAPGAALTMSGYVVVEEQG